MINKSHPSHKPWQFITPSALCQDTFHSPRQVQLHSCSYSWLKGKVSSQQDMGQLWATETQHLQPTDCSAGLNPEPITGTGGCSCPQHLQTTPETSPAWAWVWRNWGSRKGKPGRIWAANIMQISCHIAWELLNMLHPHTVALHWLPFNLRPNYQGKKHFTFQENF